MKNKLPRPLFHLSLLSLSIASAVTLAAEPTKPVEAEEVIVTGYRGSLQSATNAKRESTALVESVFAEDIGKFSDSNIAEAINRMPGYKLIAIPSVKALTYRCAAWVQVLRKYSSMARRLL